MDELKDKMSPSRLAAVNEECARLNARSVLQRMEAMQTQLDGYRAELKQTNDRLMQLQQQLNLQGTLAAQIAKHGRGPTV